MSPEGLGLYLCDALIVVAVGVVGAKGHDLGDDRDHGARDADGAPDGISKNDHFVGIGVGDGAQLREVVNAINIKGGVFVITKSDVYICAGGVGLLAHFLIPFFLRGFSPVGDPFLALF